MKSLLMVAGCLLMSGCATSFTGSAHIEGGRQTCEAKCKGQGMELAGMVYMGEYSSGCVCSAPGQTAMTRQSLLASGASAAAAAGVAMQSERSRQAAWAATR